MTVVSVTVSVHAMAGVSAGVANGGPLPAQDWGGGDLGYGGVHGRLMHAMSSVCTSVGQGSAGVAYACANGAPKACALWSMGAGTDVANSVATVHASRGVVIGVHVVALIQACSVTQTALRLPA